MASFLASAATVTVGPLPHSISSRDSSFLSSLRIPSRRPFSSAPSLPSFSIECSSRSQKKCTAHHNKTRPKKHNPYDKNRKPPVYPKPPKAPPIVTLGWGDEESSPVPSAEPVLTEP